MNANLINNIIGFNFYLIYQVKIRKNSIYLRYSVIFIKKLLWDKNQAQPYLKRLNFIFAV